MVSSTLDNYKPLAEDSSVEPEKRKRTIVNMEVTPEYLARLRIGAAAEDRPVASFMRQAIKERLAGLVAQGLIPPDDND